MKRFLTASAALLAASCAGGVPSMGVGGPQGFTIYNGEGTPIEAYQSAYGRIPNHHRFLEEALRLSPVDRATVSASLDDILRDLRVMAGCVAPSQQPAFGPLIDEYQAWRAILAEGRSSGLLSAARDLETRVRIDLSPSKFSFPPRVPPGPEASPPPSGVSPWMAYAAWKSSHADLVDAVKKLRAAEAAAAWKQLRESLKILRSALDGERRTRVQVYGDFYARLARDSRDFTVFSGELSHDKALTELEVVAGSMAAIAPAKPD